jgi:hypothetical protein
MTFSRIDPFTAMRGLPVLFTALAEKDLDQIVKLVLRILHAARDWIRFFGKS